MSRVLPASHPKAAGIGFISPRYLIIYKDNKTIIVYRIYNFLLKWVLGKLLYVAHFIIITLNVTCYTPIFCFERFAYSLTGLMELP